MKVTKEERDNLEKVGDKGGEADKGGLLDAAAGLTPNLQQRNLPHNLQSLEENVAN